MDIIKMLAWEINTGYIICAENRSCLYIQCRVGVFCEVQGYSAWFLILCSDSGRLIFRLNGAI